MELFVIHCTTCRARLKVHDPAVVGQIIECPKCRSFVAVTPPPDWQSPAASQSSAVAPAVAKSSATASGASSGPVAESAATAGIKTPAPVARGATPPPLPKRSGSSMAGMSSSIVIKLPTPGSGAHSAPRAAATTGSWAPQNDRPAAASAASEGAGTDRRAASVALALLSQYRWWVVCSTAAMVTVASAAWMVGGSRDAAPTTVADQVVEPAPEVKPEPAQAVAEPAPAEQAPEPQAVTAAVSAPPISQEPAETKPEVATATPSSEGEKLVAGAIAADVDPLGPTPYGTSGGDSPEASAGSTSTTAAEKEEESGAGETFDPVKQARLMAHLQDKLPALEFANVPVGQFVAFLSEFSTVPMVIDTQSLVDAGKSAKVRISVKLDDATVEDALKAALGKPGLAFHIEPGRLVITSRAAKSR